MKEAEKEASRWLAQAIDDLRFVQWIQKENRFFDKGCFIAQQSGEKALKACLYGIGRRRVIGHSLFEMVSELSKEATEFQPVVDSCKRLDRFYIPTRYPNGLPGGTPFEVYTDQDLRGALDDLTAVLAIAQKYLKKLGISGS